METIIIGVLIVALIGLFMFQRGRHSFLTNLKWRRAVKHFGTGTVDVKPIEMAIVEAPSSFGLQPYKVLVITDSEKKRRLRSFSFNQAQIEECNVLYVFCAMKDIELRLEQFIDETKNTDMRNMIKQFLDACPDKLAWAKQQAFISLGFGLAAAAETMVYSCPMEGFIADKYAEELGLDGNLVPCVLLAVGSESKEELHPRFRFGASDLLIRL